MATIFLNCMSQGYTNLTKSTFEYGLTVGIASFFLGSALGLTAAEKVTQAYIYVSSRYRPLLPNQALPAHDSLIQSAQAIKKTLKTIKQVIILTGITAIPLACFVKGIKEGCLSFSSASENPSLITLKQTFSNGTYQGYY